MTIRCFVVLGLAGAAACAPAHRPVSSPTRSDPARAELPKSDIAAAAERAGAAGAEAARRQADSVRLSVGEVAQQAQRVFGDSIVATDEAPRDSVEAAENGPSWDIDVESYVSKDRVEHFVRMFSGRSRDRIAERLQQGTRYEPMIRQRFRDGGLPEDMYYLALVESGFNPHAYSRAAAVGMWQFMTSTGRGMGLRIDWWVDERRDPIRSTAAAVRFIRGLRAQFGSLYLAAAAYNGGPGRVARGLKRFEDELEGQQGEDLFFALAEQDYLRKETKDYVPQLIAAALVAKDPERYGLHVKPLAPFAYDSARVGPESSLPAIARAAGTTLSAIQDLNPHLLRGVTPPKGEWTIRVPVGSAERFAETWAELSRQERTGLRRAVTKKGVSLESVASAHDISARQLLAYNPGLRRTRKGRIIPGQTLVVPTRLVAAAALSVPDPGIERYGSSTRSTRSRRAELHVVKRGESLSTIARKYGTTSARLQKLNRLRKPLIFPGQSIVVSAVPSTRATTVRRSARIVQAGRTSNGDVEPRGTTRSRKVVSSKRTTGKKAVNRNTKKKSATR